MPENENITTYPEEPTNPSGYEGFEKSVYYILSLLRYMYYSKVESENKFYTKNGGTITGSVTIQGNLVVNGQSYSIDTENLKVGDYTITLAKDNEQTLTSMVGMVVPKYDGTNYGFFGWDADGYAYVGDLTNYDGTSAITLANNSSLQRISTIDTTNTVVASNGVIYVYDATSHCFKKPTNDNKYYVIRNGAFVETELFTEQKSKNIDNALYNIGAFDTVSGNTITRGGWKATLNKSDYTWTLNGNGTIYYMTAFSSIIDKPSGDNVKGNIICNKLTTVKYDTLYAQEASSGIAISSGGSIGISVSDYAILDEIEVEFKLATPYTETIIPNQPLLTLDQDGCNFLRNEWEKGLNLFNKNLAVDGIIRTQNGIQTGYNAYCLVDMIPCKPNTTYTCTYFNRICFMTSSQTYIDKSEPAAGIYVVTFTTPSNCYYMSVDLLITDKDKVMLNYGTHPYPYQEYNGAIVREKDIEPVLLWENSSPTASFVPSNLPNGDNSITVKDMTPYKYIVIEFKHYYEWADLQTTKIRYNYGGNYSSFTISSINAQASEVISRRCYFLSNTKIKFDDCSQGGNTINNQLIIPVAIYGTNVL